MEAFFRFDLQVRQAGIETILPSGFGNTSEGAVEERVLRIEMASLSGRTRDQIRKLES